MVQPEEAGHEGIDDRNETLRLWRAIKGARAKQPYAIAMKDASPFGLAGLWENWRNPSTGEWERTFAINTDEC